MNNELPGCARCPANHGANSRSHMTMRAEDCATHRGTLLGSWVIMMCIFAGAYLLAYPLRRFWN